MKYLKDLIAWLKELRSQGWLVLLRELWLWFVAIVFSIIGLCAFCAFIGLLVVGAKRLLF